MSVVNTWQFRLLILVVATCTGRVFWQLSEVFLPFAGVMMLCFTLGRLPRIWGYAVFSSFYLSGTWPLVGAGSSVFESGLAIGAGIWMGHGLLCSLPILLLKGTRPGLRAATVAALFILPPFGFLAPCNPSVLIGLLLPRSGIAGVFGFLWIAAVVGVWHRDHRGWWWPQAAICIGIVAGLNVWTLVSPTPQVPANWVALNTNFGENGKDLETRLKVGNIALPEFLESHSASLADGAVVFLAEGLLYDQSDFTQAMWDHAIGSRNITVVVGANRLAEDGLGSVSGVAVFGAGKVSGNFASELEQIHAGMTFPAAMWHPWQPIEHFAFGWPNSGLEVDGHRTHISWCYESTLLWPHLLVALNPPEVFVSLENRWSSKETSLESAQTVTSRLVARYLGAAQLVSMNH